MKIWHLGDTHGFHEGITPPDRYDTIVFSGDCSNHRDPARNTNEVLSFLDWFEQFDAPKIFVSGNHETSVEAGMVRRKDFTNRGIIYLEDESETVQGINFYGSPWTPRYGNWSWNLNRNVIGRKWDEIPFTTHVLVTHGPPKGILDLCLRDREVTQQGCSALRKRVGKLKLLQAHLFGHIHDRDHLSNAGVLQRDGLTYSNGSCVVEGGRQGFGLGRRFGNVIEVDNYDYTAF